MSKIISSNCQLLDILKMLPFFQSGITCGKHKHILQKKRHTSSFQTVCLDGKTTQPPRVLTRWRQEYWDKQQAQQEAEVAEGVANDKAPIEAAVPEAAEAPEAPAEEEPPAEA